MGYTSAVTNMLKWSVVVSRDVFGLYTAVQRCSECPVPRDIQDQSWTALWTTWSTCRCPCSLQGILTKLPLVVPSNSNDSLIRWFWVVMECYRFIAKGYNQQFYFTNRGTMWLWSCFSLLPAIQYHTGWTSLFLMVNHILFLRDILPQILLETLKHIKLTQAS